MSHRTNPEAAAATMRAAGVEPLVPYPGAQAKWRCRCLKCGAEVTPRYGNVNQGSRGCWPCAQADRRRIPPAKASAVMEAAGMQPLVPYPGSHERWLCRCVTCGRTSSPMYKMLVSRGSACKPCALERRGRAKRVDGAAAIEVMRRARLEPLAPYPLAGEPWPCRCINCGQETAPRYNSIRRGHTGCWTCQHKLTGGASQRLTHEAAAEVMVKNGFEPLDPYHNSTSQWRCRCLRCGTEVTPTYGNIRSGWGGCRTCSPGGFDATQAAILYLVTHQALGAAKVGIGNTRGRRLKEHQAGGWEVHAVVQVPGAIAETIEASVLGWWRTSLGLPPFLSAREMPQGGWTETVDLDAIDLPATIRQIKKLALPDSAESD